MLTAMMRASMAAVLTACLAAGCGSKGSIALSASIQQPRVAVEQLTLGSRLTGGFELVLEVGPEATDGSTVSLEKFELVRVADSASLTPLAVLSESHGFPLRVAKGQLVRVPFVFDDAELVQNTVREAVCLGPVRIAGAITDTLSGGSTTPLASAPVSPSGC